MSAEPGYRESTLARLRATRAETRRKLRGLREYADRNRVAFTKGATMPEAEVRVWSEAVTFVEDEFLAAARTAVQCDALEVANEALGFACDLADLRNVAASIATALREGEAARARADEVAR